jgi:hypothetical protein
MSGPRARGNGKWTAGESNPGAGLNSVVNYTQMTYMRECGDA